MKRKVILDVDTGSDDAIAIMLALQSPELEVVAICTCWGNTSLEYTTLNTLRLLARMGKDIPVYRGLPDALVKSLCLERVDREPLELVVDGKKVRMHAHEFDLPHTHKKAENLTAPFFYKNYLSESKEPIYIVTTGPLSNLGFALSLWPELADQIAGLTIMGGGYKVNNIRYAEANFWQDPEAVKIILNSGVKPLLVPLDATHRAYITEEEIEVLRKIGSFESEFAVELLGPRQIMHDYLQPLDVPHAATVHDAVAVAAFIDENVLDQVKEVHLDIGIGDSAEGHCTFDRRQNSEAPNCRFAFSAHRERFIELLLNRFQN